MANFKTAWNAFWAIFGDDEKAEAWKQIADGGQPKPAELPAATPQPKPEEDGDAAAIHLLAIMQREARLVDFLQESLDGYDDATVGAVSRKVHDDCKRTLDKYFSISPIMAEEEQSSVTVPVGFDAARIKVSGNSIGEPPYKGTLQHKGWSAVSKGLPKRSASQDSSIVFPAEVEI